MVATLPPPTDLGDAALRSLGSAIQLSSAQPQDPGQACEAHETEQQRLTEPAAGGTKAAGQVACG
jgi:hypothetical protein